MRIPIRVQSSDDPAEWENLDQFLCLLNQWENLDQFLCLLNQWENLDQFLCLLNQWETPIIFFCVSDDFHLIIWLDGERVRPLVVFLKAN